MPLLAEAFESWRSGSELAKQLGSDGVAHISEETDGTSFVVRFGPALVMVAVPQDDGDTFFVSGADEDESMGSSNCDPEVVEEWLTDVNSYFAEKSKARDITELLEFMAKTLPKSLSGAKGAGEGKKEVGGHADFEEEDEDGDDYMTDVEALVVPEGGDDEERQAKRQQMAEDQKWQDKVEKSLGHVGSSRQASQSLMREMRSLLALKDGKDSPNIEIDLVKDSLYHWRVFLGADGFPSNCPLRTDLVKYAERAVGQRGADSSGGSSGSAGDDLQRKAGILFDVVFPPTYPMLPPFIRVVYPRFGFHTGHITIGGSICMELLTASGWVPTYSVESIFVQIRSEVIDGGGRVDFNNMREYTEAEAKQAFERVARQHGWKTS